MAKPPEQKQPEAKTRKPRTKKPMTPERAFAAVLSIIEQLPSDDAKRKVMKTVGQWIGPETPSV